MRLIFDADGGAARELDEAELTELYRFPVPPDRAYVRSNFVMSLDGSVQGPDGRSGGINTESDHEVFALQRALCDAVLVGAGTVRAEGYRAIDLAPWQRDLRERENLAPFPTLVVLSRSGNVGENISEPADGAEGGPVVITDAADLGQLLDHLAGTGLVRLLCEGGPGLHGQLIAAGLLDELLLTLAPVAVGGAGLRSTSGPVIDPVADFALRFALHADDGTLFTAYRRLDDPAPKAPRLS